MGPRARRSRWLAVLDAAYALSGPAGVRGHRKPPESVRACASPRGGGKTRCPSRVAPRLFRALGSGPCRDPHKVGARMRSLWRFDDGATTRDRCSANGTAWRLFNSLALAARILTDTVAATSSKSAARPSLGLSSASHLQHQRRLRAEGVSHLRESAPTFSVQTAQASTHKMCRTAIRCERSELLVMPTAAWTTPTRKGLCQSTPAHVRHVRPCEQALRTARRIGGLCVLPCARRGGQCTARCTAP